VSHSTAWLASSNPLLGTWRLKSYVVTTGTGERSTPYGEQPIGYLSYSADGRMQVIGTASGRNAPHNAAPANDERVSLYDTMFAYAGTFSVNEGKVTHHVDISWNEAWNGTDQVRFYEVHGNTLTITSRLTDPTSGAESQYDLVWERVATPH
jgi:Lipocalin-like domain